EFALVERERDLVPVRRLEQLLEVLWLPAERDPLRLASVAVRGNALHVEQEVDRPLGAHRLLDIRSRHRGGEAVRLGVLSRLDETDCSAPPAPSPPLPWCRR